MESCKSEFIKMANKYGIAHVRIRDEEHDLTGWGSLEFLLNNGFVFVISPGPFGQDDGENGLYVDCNCLNEYMQRLLRWAPRKAVRDSSL